MVPKIHSTHKSGRVVVPDCLCVAERLQQRVGLQDDVLDPGGGLPSSGHLGQVAHEVLGGHGLASAGLATAKRRNEFETR